MRHYLIIPISICLALLSACGSASQNSSVELSATASSERGSPDAMHRLLSLPLPDEWTRMKEGDGATFHLPSEFVDPKEAALHPHSFRATVLMSRDCDQAYVLERLHLNWGKTIPKKYAVPSAISSYGDRSVGYFWREFHGVGANTVPTDVHWCIHHPEKWMDLDIVTDDSDRISKISIEEAFIPLWLGKMK